MDITLAIVGSFLFISLALGLYAARGTNIFEDSISKNSTNL